MVQRAGIALGSNLGDSLLNIQQARQMLYEKLNISPKTILSAPVFETQPLDCPANSPTFLNTVIELPCPFDAIELLKITQSIQQELGRNHHAAHHAPRTIDLDILYLGELILELPHFTLPHPRIVERDFVLLPLYYIRPDLILPLQHQTIASLCQMFFKEREKPPIILQSW